MNAKEYIIKHNLNFEDFKKQGVYRITLNTQEKCYIGSSTINFRARLGRHLVALIKNKHHSIKLQNAFNKYGIDCFVFEIIEIVKTKSKKEILEKEQFFIDFYNSYHKGYNSTKKAGNSLGFKMYENVVEKRRKKYLQYDLKGNFLKEWGSYSEIVKTLGHFSNKKVLKSSNYTSYNSLWRYKTDNHSLKIDPHVNLCKHPIYQYNLKGQFINKFESLLEASTKLNIPCGNISKHLQKLTKICYGFYFSKEERNFEIYEKIHLFQKKLKVTNLITNEIIEYKSLREMAKIKKINRGSISEAIKNKNGIMLNKKLKIEEI